MWGTACSELHGWDPTNSKDTFPPKTPGAQRITTSAGREVQEAAAASGALFKMVTHSALKLAVQVILLSEFEIKFRHVMDGLQSKNVCS